MGIYGEQISIDVQVLSSKNQKYIRYFNCNDDSINYYFRRQALKDKFSVTYLFIDINKDVAIACATVACSAILEKIDETQVSSTIISAMEIKYFAVSEYYQHMLYSKGSKLTLSHYIFSYVIEHLREMSHNQIGASKIVLYSVSNSKNFYKRCKFKEFEDTMYGDEGKYRQKCTPMYYDLN